MTFWLLLFSKDFCFSEEFGNVGFEEGGNLENHGEIPRIMALEPWATSSVKTTPEILKYGHTNARGSWVNFTHENPTLG